MCNMGSGLTLDWPGSSHVWDLQPDVQLASRSCQDVHVGLVGAINVGWQWC